MPKDNILLNSQISPFSLKKIKVFLCTLDMLNAPNVQALARKCTLETLVIDEASQIEMKDYISILSKFGNHIQKICFIGDDKQCKHITPYLSFLLLSHIDLLI